jgi:hypothetical protein
MNREQLDDLARTIIDSNRYMALGTADADGRGVRVDLKPGTSW